jgi:hypothetical protein
MPVAGVLMGVIAAQLGHADTRMTEKHYAHLAQSYIAQTIRANFPVLDLASEFQVIPSQSGTIIAVFSWGFGGQSVVSQASSEFDRKRDLLKLMS